MITLNEVLQLHEKSIKDYGGSAGVRDINLLERAISNRPFHTFGGTEFILYIIMKRQPLLSRV